MRFWHYSLLLLACTATQAFAHHSMAAAYDDKKPTTIKGVVTKFDWTNPHVFVFIDVAAANGDAVTWAAEFPSRIELKRQGWTDDSLKVGDTVTAEGSLARDGSKQIGGRQLTLANGKKLMAVAGLVPLTAKDSKPTPRWPDGHPRLGFVPGETGYWTAAPGSNLFENGSNAQMDANGLLANISTAGKVAPFQPWAKGLYEYRQRALLKDDPMAACLPPGGPRQFQTANGLQILEEPERKRIFVMSGGGNRNWRLINLDGRAHKPDDVIPTYYGDSVGQWEGDTLVVDSIGFNERFWFANGGLPHTEALHLTERISRPDFNTLKYEVTVNDPGAYIRPWSGSLTLQWVPNQEIEEYFCDEYNRDLEHVNEK
jgi:hypothetical protein